MNRGLNHQSILPFVGIAFVVIIAAMILQIGKHESVAAAAPNIDGNAQNGVLEIQAYGCGACHTIPGVAGADGVVGPPMNAIARRSFIAGKLRNTPDNLVRWIQHPQAINPGNGMPDMGVTESAARDIAAYLYTLR